MSGYLDSLSDHLDGAYMKVQVAMEAFCHDVPKAGTANTTLVKQPKAWSDWVDAHADEITSFAHDSDAAKRLVAKAKSAMQPPSSDAVEDALDALGLQLPPAVMEELPRRNTSVHRFVMTHKKARVWTDEAARLEKVRTALTAIVMRHVGYSGPIAGWERDSQGRRPTPTWWPVAAAPPAANTLYVCERRLPAKPSRKLRYERILALDGGGTWALIQVHALLRVFADALGEDATGHQVLERFDLVVANSGGSIVAAALACNMRLKDIAAMFESSEARKSIFRAKLPEVLGRLLPLPRYPMRGKYDGLRERLPGDALLSLPDWHAQHGSLAHLLIIGFDYDTNRAAFFRSDTTSRARSAAPPTTATILDAAHASSNAPVLYFDMPTHLPAPPGRRRYWDGAVAGYNNPALAAAIEALSNGAAPEKIRILSIGTGTVQRPRRPEGTAPRDGRFVGGESHGILRDGQKLAGAILDDPPDAASFAAHVVLGGALPIGGGPPVTQGPVVRLNPSIRPVWTENDWTWGTAFTQEQWLRLTAIDMDAMDKNDVGLIRKLADAWLADAAPNQAIRADDHLDAEIGHNTFTAAMRAAGSWLP